jgi:multiple sugar transport system ATP-binding protein
VQVGLRPQALALSSQGELRGEIEAIERLGSDGFVYVKTEAGSVVARFEGAPNLHVGEAAQISVAPGSLHLFDADGGKALAKAPALSDSRPRTADVKAPAL